MKSPDTDHRFAVAMTDDGTARRDLAARQEFKYVFAAADPSVLRSELLRTCRPVIYAGRVSTVCSIYFDDHSLSSCRANLDGLAERHKTRIRWYDRPEPGRDLFFEIKWRRNRVTGKHRLRLAATEDAADVGYRDLVRALRRNLPPAHQGTVATSDAAIVLVQYKREHFVAMEGDTRLTLDYDMRFYPQLGHRRVNRRFGQHLDGVVLVEGKMKVGNSSALRRIVQPLRARASRFSKYVVGCHQLGFVHAA